MGSKVCKGCGEKFHAMFAQKLYCNRKCYEKSRPKRQEETKARKVIKRDYMRSFKLEKGCEICGYKEHPAALHFDHIDPSEKRYSPASLQSYKWETLHKELAKCRVLCANCHHIHTYNQNETKS